jgi:hypothetical protein
MVEHAVLNGIADPRVRAGAGSDGTAWYASWQVWATGLVLVYLATAVAGWGRAVIWDEIWLATNAGGPFETQLRLIRNDIAHPPLFYMIARGWIAFFGGSDNSIKVLPLVFNVPALIAFTILARRVTKYWREATLLFSGIYWQVGSVPNLVRAYGLICLLTILAILAWKNWSDDGRMRWLAGWTAAVSGVALSHYFGVLLVCAFVIVNALRGRRPLLFLGAAAVPAILLLPWALYLLPVWSAGAEVRPDSLTWIDGAGGLGDLAGLAFAFLGYTEPGAAPFRPWNIFDEPRYTMIATVGAVAAHVVLTAILAGWWIRNRGRHDANDRVREWLPVLLILFVFPLLGLIGLSRLAPLFHPRFLIGSLPIYWLLFALAADASPRIGRAFTWGLVGWLALVAFKISEPSLRPWPVTAAVMEIDRNAQPGDVVIADNQVGEYAWWEFDRVLQRERTLHVFRARDRDLIPPRELRGNNILPYTDIAEIDLTEAETIWLIHSRRLARDIAFDHLATLGFVPDDTVHVTNVGPTRFTRINGQR